MADWPQRPTLYEINTWAWLHDLSQRHRRNLTLAEVPPQEWDVLAEYGFDAVWLMGVWERSPRGVHIARDHPALQADYRRALPDFTRLDVVGSPYAVHRYEPDPYFGGAEGLAVAREALAARGMRLLLDFVPNHVAPDHPWVFEHPEYLVQGDSTDLADEPDAFFQEGGRVFAHGRDPHFPPWTDTAQLNAFHPGLRQAVIDTLKSIAARCDGVRCDMAMLVVNRVFAKTWGQRAGERPAQEFWWQVIQAVRQDHPDFLFVAEAYWDMEWELQQQGFDYCYDKRLYERLRSGSADEVRAHLAADLAYQDRLLRFIENHDEPRAAAVFDRYSERAAATAFATLPGARLFHEGQLEGYRVRLPVQLGRRQTEPVDPDLRSFYRTLLHQIAAPVFHDGAWQLCPASGWIDNASWQHLLAWCWRLEETRRLIVINYSPQPAQGRVRLPWEELAGYAWQLVDPFSGDSYLRNGTEMLDPGLYVGLPPWGIHFLHVQPA